MKKLFGTLFLAAAVLAPLEARAQRVVEVQIAPPYLRMRPDAETSVLATAYDADGNPVPTTFRWTSSNINVVQVSPDGVIKAVGPGAALVTAAVASDPRRRGQLTVYVGRAPRTPAPPPTPGETVRVFVGPGVAPPAPPPPGWRGDVRVNVDSAWRQSIDCGDPTLNAINPLRTCWDQRPMPPAAPVLAAPSECGDDLTPVTLLVKVSDAGRVVEVRDFAPSRCFAFADAARAMLRTWTFTPAQREGRPVEAWVLQRVVPAKHLPR
jgi:hypothetical protein